MADKPFAQMRSSVSGLKEKCTSKVREGTSRLSPRQRIVILTILFTTFIVVDVVYIVGGIRGGRSDNIRIQHLKQMEIETLKSNQNDTIPQYSPGE